MSEGSPNVARVLVEHLTHVGSGAEAHGTCPLEERLWDCVATVVSGRTPGRLSKRNGKSCLEHGEGGAQFEYVALGVLRRSIVEDWARERKLSPPREPRAQASGQGNYELTSRKQGVEQVVRAPILIVAECGRVQTT